MYDLPQYFPHSSADLGACICEYTVLSSHACCTLFLLSTSLIKFWQGFTSWTWCEAFSMSFHNVVISDILINGALVSPFWLGTTSIKIGWSDLKSDKQGGCVKESSPCGLDTGLFIIASWGVFRVLAVNDGFGALARLFSNAAAQARAAGTSLVACSLMKNEGSCLAYLSFLLSATSNSTWIVDAW